LSLAGYKAVKINELLEERRKKGNRSPARSEFKGQKIKA
jgi:hypothetical protein